MVKRKFTQFTLMVMLVLAAVSLLWIKSAQAANGAFRYDTKVSYVTRSDMTTQVEEVYTITNQTARQYLTELKLTTPSDNINNLSVRYSDGTSIPTKVTAKPVNANSFSTATQEITIAFPRVNAGAGQRWQFVVRYQTAGLTETKGSSHTVYVPALEASDQRNTYQVTVDVPEDFGTPHFTDSDSHLVLKGGGRQVYDFDRADVANHSLALVFGDSTIYNLTFKSPLQNNSPVPRTFTVTLPPDLSTQSVVVKSLQPAPRSTRLDSEGNVLAEYTVGAYQKITVTAQVEGQARYRDYNLSASGTKKDLPADIVAAYTKPTHYWQTDGAVAQAAHSIVRDDAKVSDNVRAVYRYVIDRLTYNNQKIAFNVRQGAAKAFANPNNAVCLEYADLMVAMLRSQGIPARMVVGYAYAGSIKASPAVADSLHAWVEAYVPKVGWITVDPTWGEKFDDFGRSDLDHFAFAVWGKSDSSPGAVMAGGSDTGYQYENTKLSFSEVQSSVTPSGQLAVDRYVIAPFVALDWAQIGAQPQVVSTSNSLAIGSRVIELGSLAPNQKLTRRFAVWGLSWNASTSATLHHHVNGKEVVVARTVSKVHYTPMMILGGLIIAIFLIRMVRLRTVRRASQVKKVYTDVKRGRNVLDE